MATFLMGAISFCGFCSFIMGLTTVIDFSNKDIKVNKAKKGATNDEIESFREEHGRTYKVR